jgi:CheY-like chemotaxis protein
VLMDVQMPEMDGLEATRLIRSEERRNSGGARVPILALTAHASGSQHAQCLAEGMDGVLTKPISLQVLMREVRAVLQKVPV